MSGLAKGIGKVFKKIVKVVKKIAPVVLAVGAIALTAGAGAGVLGVAGSAGATTAAAGTAGAASGGGFLSSFASSLGLTGAGTAAATTAGAAGAAGVGAAGAASSVTGSILGKVFSSPLLGKALAGAAAGYGQAKTLEAANQFEIDAEVRRQGTYAGVGDAANFDLAGATKGFVPMGLGGNQMQSSEVVGPRDEAQIQVASAEPPMQGLKPSYKPPRSPVVANTSGQQAEKPKYRYNPETKRIDYA